MAVVLPVSAFVPAGFEHSITNIYFILLRIWNSADATPEGLDWIVSGRVVVALVYWATSICAGFLTGAS